jgi:5-formyltetrahydrofolate cyclo-ligase
MRRNHENLIFRTEEQVWRKEMEMKREKFPDPVTGKEEIRRKMRSTLRGLAPEKHAEASLEICRLAAALPAFREAKIVALFAPLPSEPDIHPLIEEAWAQSKRVAFPLMLQDGDSPRLEWHEVTAWDEIIVAGPFGIREPDPVRCPRIESESIQCAFVPGLAFDASGNRLGRGGGYYDSAIAAATGKIAWIGLMFACQEIPKVPRESHDQRLPEILTENGLLSPSS